MRQVDQVDPRDLFVDYGSRRAGERSYVLRERGHFGSSVFQSDSKSEVIAEVQRRKGWTPVNGDERTYGQQIADHAGEAR